MSAQEIMALLIIALFMLIPLAMGAVAGKKSIPTTEDYFVQGRGMGSVAVFFTVAATLSPDISFHVMSVIFPTAFHYTFIVNTAMPLINNTDVRSFQPAVENTLTTLPPTNMGGI